MNYDKNKLKTYLKNILSIPSPSGCTYKVMEYNKKRTRFFKSFIY